MKFNYDFFEILGPEHAFDSLYVTVSIPDGKSLKVRIRTCQWARGEDGVARPLVHGMGKTLGTIELDITGAMALKKILERLEEAVIMEEENG